MRWVAFLLLFPAAFAVDISRVSIHELDSQLVDHAVYTDYFRGDLASSVEGWVTIYGGEFQFVRSRLPAGFNLSSWEINITNSTTTVLASGINDAFATRVGEAWKVSGKGFIDRICDDVETGTIKPISQDFESRVAIPAGFVILSVPESGYERMRYLDYDYAAVGENNLLVENLNLTVKSEAEALAYCNERAKLEEVLRQGFFISKKLDPSTGYLVWVVGILASVFLVSVTLAYNRSAAHNRSARSRK
ncbi:hypothetical protein HY546_00920 [archaeon]|nr:hypothetical protein [archaeon]